MIIADRGFGDLWTLVERKFHGTLASNLFKYGTGGWQVQNAVNYLKTRKKNPCYKVVMCDKNDEIVHLPTSLMVGIANELKGMRSLKVKNTDIDSISEKMA